MKNSDSKPNLTKKGNLTHVEQKKTKNDLFIVPGYNPEANEAPKMSYELLNLVFRLKYDTFHELGVAMGGYSRAYVSNLLKGNKIPTKVSVIYLLADALGIQRHMLLLFFKEQEGGEKLMSEEETNEEDEDFDDEDDESDDEDEE